MKTSRILCLAIATLLTFGSFARAESLEHIDELASTAERQARHVLYQSYSLHAYGPTAQELKGDASRMIRLARHIHDVAHVDHRFAYGRHSGHGGRIDRLAHINHDVAELDQLIHHMQDVVIRMKARIPVRRSHYSPHGAGNISVSFGNHFSLTFGNSRGASRYHHNTRFRAPSTVDQIEIGLAKLLETVHHLLEDTEVVCIHRR
jgi:hypothetical protein